MVQNIGRNDIVSIWIIINSGSTCTIICNSYLFMVNHEVDCIIRFKFNVGQNVVKFKGFLCLYGDYVLYLFIVGTLPHYIRENAHIFANVVQPLKVILSFYKPQI